MSSPIGPFVQYPAGSPVYFTPETVASIELVQTGAVVRPVVWSTGSAPPVTLAASELGPLHAALVGAGIVFAVFSQFGSGLDLYINVATALATWNIENAPQGVTPVTALRDQTGEAWLVLGDVVATAAHLAAAAPPPPGAPAFRNTFDGYSSQLSGSLDVVITTDADRLINADELVWGNSITWDQPGTTARAWTMPSLASMDAFIAAESAGRALTLPGSGAKSLWLVNKSNAPLTILDSADFHSAEGVGITIPPREKALLTWSHATDRIVDGIPSGSPAATWYCDVSAGAPRAGDAWAGGIVAGGGAVLGGWGGLTPSAPYVPGSGIYGLAMNPVPPGWAYLLQVTQLQGPPAQLVLGATPTGPGVFTVSGDSIPTGAWGDWAFMVTAFLIAP